jgi:hypothetical protein
MKKYEYTIRINCELEDLNKLGQEGWNLIKVIDNQIMRRFYFKKSISKKLDTAS